MTAPAPAAGAGPATVLADRLLPAFDFAEAHGLSGVKASPQAAMQAIDAYDDRSDPLLHAALQLRELPARIAHRLRIGGAGLAPSVPRFGLRNFTRLERTPDAVAFALTGRFWARDFGLVPCPDTAGFERFAAPGSARLLLCFGVHALADGTVRIATVTRIQCTDAVARRRMLPYWLLIRPVSGWIRLRILRRLKAGAEALR